MTKLFALLLALFALTISARAGDKSESKLTGKAAEKPTVYIDTDTAAEIDDSYALFRALVAPEFHIVGISAIGFEGPGDFATNTRNSEKMIAEILTLTNRQDEIAHPLGALKPMPDAATPVDSPAARDIIAKAKALPDGEKLQLFALGAFTNVASALLLDPSIKDRVTINVMGYHYVNDQLTSDESNAQGDLHAAKFLLKSGVELNIMPNTTLRKFQWSKADVEAHFKGQGGIRDYLLNRWNAVAPNDPQHTMWDIAVFEATLHPNLATITDINHNGTKIHLWTAVDVKAMQADYWAATAPHDAAQPEAKWKIGAPIITYWAGPGSKTDLDDRAAEQLRAGGWNVGWTHKPEDLDIYDRHGLRVIFEIGTPDIYDPAQAKALDATIDRVRNHPALYAYFLTDEPGAGAFPKLGKLVAWLRKRDPAHFAFINLLPTYASDGQLQVSDATADRAKVGYPQDFAGIQTDDKTALRYREHLRQFIDTVHPDLLSYDHYHFLKNSDGTQYFLNLALVRSTSQAANIPFLNMIQACDSPAEGWRPPNENELRWLTYTSLAYGAQGLAHFRYDTGFFKDPKGCEIPAPLYAAASQFNHEFLAIATELQSLKSIGVYHCGKVPLGGQPLPTNSAFAPKSASQEILLGYFGESPDHPTHVVVVNLNYKNAADVTLKGPAAMETFHAPTGTWRTQTEGNQIKFTLPPGGGALIRLTSASASK